VKLTLIPWALDKVWRTYATHPIGLAPTTLPLRGADRNAAVQLEQLAAVEATRA
jgi:hypothetical protein